MVKQQVAIKTRLRIENNSKRIVLVICDGVSSAETMILVNEVTKKIKREGKRRVLIYVISPLSRPKYFEVIRRLIQENISLSMSIRYSGSKPENLLELIRKLDNPDVFIAGLCRDFIQALDGIGYKNVIVI